jgi:hypothetical protein
MFFDLLSELYHLFHTRSMLHPSYCTWGDRKVRARGEYLFIKLLLLGKKSFLYTLNNGLLFHIVIRTVLPQHDAHKA